MPQNQNIAVLGASPKKDRYSNKAIHLLLEYGYTVFPVNPAYDVIDNVSCHKSLADIKEALDTITIYMGKGRSDLLIDQILSCKPRRIIMNPGAENPDLKTKAVEASIEVVEACTLVMLKTGKF